MAQAMPKILVVDDDKELRAALCMFFESLGYDAESAADGLTALERLQRDRPDLLLLDQHLPQLDGRALAARAHAQIPELAIGVLSADTGDAPPHVDFVLCKPAAPRALGAAVQAVFSRRAASAR
jgi:CheY-like chemotaxis protein